MPRLGKKQKKNKIVVLHTDTYIHISSWFYFFDDGSPGAPAVVVAASVKP